MLRSVASPLLHHHRSTHARTLACAFSVFVAACGTHGEEPPGPDAGEGEGEGDGLHQIDVPRPDGGSDPMWIYAKAPAGPGPFPVVVYGHGQGAGNFVNCEAHGPPADGDALTGREIVDDLAEAGYLAVALTYRNRGAGVPATGELRPRDSYVLDASAFLAAARWAGDQHERRPRRSLPTSRTASPSRRRSRWGCSATTSQTQAEGPIGSTTPISSSAPPTSRWPRSAPSRPVRRWRARRTSRPSTLRESSRTD